MKKKKREKKENSAQPAVCPESIRLEDEKQKMQKALDLIKKFPVTNNMFPKPPEQIWQLSR